MSDSGIKSRLSSILVKVEEAYKNRSAVRIFSYFVIVQPHFYYIFQLLNFNKCVVLLI